MIFAAVPWAAFAACALLAVSGFWRMARTQGGYRDAGCWHAPLIFTSAAVALLAALGVLPPGPGAALALLSLLPPVMLAWKPLRSAAKTMGWPRAAAFILGRFLAFPLRNALWNAREDLRGLAGGLRPHGEAGVAPAPGSAPASPRLLEAVRSVPPLADSAPGGIPFPEEVAADLEAAGAAVSPEWQAVADLTGDFDPENQDELDEHMASEAAGLLSQAEAAGQRAETLLTGRKLHPRYAAALLEVADGYADLATLAAAAHRVYHETYGDINDWHDAEGNELPEDGRGWFGGAA